MKTIAELAAAWGDADTPEARLALLDHNGDEGFTRSRRHTHILRLATNEPDANAEFIFHLLTWEDADLDGANFHGWAMPIRCGRDDIVVALLDAGMDFQDDNDFGQALIESMSANRREITEILLGTGRWIPAAHQILRLAAQKGELAVIHCILSDRRGYALDPDAILSDYCVARLVKKPQLAVVRALVEGGAKISFKRFGTISYRTAVAESEDGSELLEVLLSTGELSEEQAEELRAEIRRKRAAFYNAPECEILTVPAMSMPFPFWKPYKLPRWISHRANTPY